MVDPANELERKATPFVSASSKVSPVTVQAADLLKTVDFSATPLGPPEVWENALKSIVSLMLESRFPMFIAWGGALTFLYNDAYADILGLKHPAAFGSSFRDIWADIWDDISPLITDAMNGIATFSEDLPLVMNRADYEEKSWFTFSYSPVRDENGLVRGMFCAVTETTDRVLLQQRQAFRLSLEEELREIENSMAVKSAASEALGRALGVARVGYGEVDYDEEHVTIDRDWTDGQIASVIGTYPIDDLNRSIMYELKAGHVVCIDDVERDPRVCTDAAFPANGSRSVLAVPLIKSGRLQSIVFLHHRVPRRWTKNDIALATDVAERTWSAVERAKSQAEKERYTERLNFLDALGRATSYLENADAILDTSTRMLGEHLGVSSCAYADMDEDEDGFTIRGDWAAEGALHITGHYRLKDFGELAVSELSSGRPLVINNNLDEIAPEEAATFQNIGISATICMPLIKNGKLTALMAVHHRLPHCWSPHELSVVREVTDRSWAHIQRVRSEAELKASQDQLRRANESLEATVAERTGELMAAEESLRHAQKMEAVGQLTGGLAHDFNNLLGGILGSLEVMRTRLAQGRFSELDKYLSAASGAAKRGASLTQRMLAFSRRQTLTPTPTDVNKLIASMQELTQRSIGPSVALELVRKADLCLALVDPGQLESAVLNLCINGRDAMPEGGILTVLTDTHQFDVEEARQLGLPAGQYHSVSVSDTGAGMTTDVMARAFDPFFTTKPIGKGTGLGLSMVWGFAGQSGGAVKISSRIGKGTTVSIYLPRFTGAIDAEQVENDTICLGSGSRKAILLVDDEPLIRMVAAEQLQDLGYVVIEAGDAREAMQILAAGQNIDLLLTDVGLPNGMNGRQLADAVRDSRQDLPILFITGYAENAVLNQGHLSKGMEVMTKPFEILELARRVEALLS